eukprot:SAG11_NODE_10034_length_861_cov_1.947507_3_plen_80_part_00
MYAPPDHLALPPPLALQLAFMVNNTSHILSKFRDSLATDASATPRGERAVATDEDNIAYWCVRLCRLKLPGLCVAWRTV